MRWLPVISAGVLPKASDLGAQRQSQHPLGALRSYLSGSVQLHQLMGVKKLGCDSQ
jgi:hypothetical protein